MRRVISVWLPRFATDRLTARRNAAQRSASRPDEQAIPAPPFALLREESGRLLLAAVDRAAAAAGLYPGLPLADARALQPDLKTAEEDPEAAARDLERLAVWCGRYTPWCGLDTQGGLACEAGGAAGLFLDVTGCDHLFGGEEALVADLVARLARLGYPARAALADTPGAAWALARFGGAVTRVVPPGRQRFALAELPPAALRLSAERLELLDRFGLDRIGDLYGLSPAALAPRFGDQVARRLGQALGLEAEPIEPARPVPALLARRILAEPILEAEAIAQGLERLAADLCRQLEKAQQGARKLELTLYRVDGSFARQSLGTSRASRDPAHLIRLFAGRIERIDPGFGIEVMTLAAARSEPLTALQLALPERAAAADRKAPACARPEPGLASCLDRLMAKLGPENVVVPAPFESHLPERAVQPLRPFETPEAPASWPARAAERPLRLFERPQPVEAMALLPDHPPASFRWRRLNLRIARAEGPERISPEWWREPANDEEELFPDPAAARDYFRAEDAEGRRYWLYRAQTRWYLQGLFA